MRILFLSPRQCFPPTTGAKLREYHLAKQLSRSAELTMLGFGLQPPEAATGDRSFCHRVCMVPVPKRYTPTKILRGVLGRQPLTIINYFSPEMKAALELLLKAGTFDVIQVEGTPMVGYASILRRLAADSLIVYDWHNIESELLDRFALNTSSHLKRLYAKITARRLRAMEADILKEAGGHLVCSDRERDQLRLLAPQARVVTVANGVDVASFGGANGLPPAQRTRILFVGSMDYHANIEAVEHFTLKIWPALRQRWPHFRLTLVGSNPALAVRQLARETGVEVTGTVADVRPYYEQAFATIVPLMTGGGTRLKILEALAAAVPVISTTLGAEGLDVTPGHQLLIANQVQEWTVSLAELVDHPSRWAEIAAAGRQLVQSTYDWGAIGEGLMATYRDWLDLSPRPPRSAVG